ncbi:MAG: hypothetical protein HN834_03040 [Rhodospirillaceae bacterium]|jgi:hypothetical protein|nr:hypothetical protein [Rhodospirillaceae bacterium]
MGDRDAFVERQGFRDVRDHTNDPLSPRMAVLVWLLLGVLCWSGVIGLFMLIL